MFQSIRIRIPVFIKIGSEFQYLEGQGQNSNSYKNKARIPMFEKITSDSNFWNDKFRIQLLIKIG